MNEMKNKVEPEAVTLATPDDPTSAPVLRAMAMNYSAGHLWDKLDARTCLHAANEIDRLRALLAGVSAPAAVAVLDYPWRDRLLDGRELVRDQQGFAEHSELPLLDEGMKPRAFFAALGVEMKHTMADDDLSMDEYDAMSDAENWSAWIPRPPIGDAWNLVAIFDTEDGPAAWWARALKESREASPQAQADARDAAPAADEQDAKRYRWLRECNSGSLVVVEITGTGDEDWHVLTEADADAAIDAAIAAQAAQQGDDKQ